MLEVLATIIIIIFITIIHAPASLLRWTCLPVDLTSLLRPASGQSCLEISPSGRKAFLPVFPHAGSETSCLQSDWGLPWQKLHLPPSDWGLPEGKDCFFSLHFCLQPSASTTEGSQLGQGSDLHGNGDQKNRLLDSLTVSHPWPGPWASPPALNIRCGQEAISTQWSLRICSL